MPDCSISVADCSIRVNQSFSVIYNLIKQGFWHGTSILPFMLALCSMLSGTYYAQKYAGIISRSWQTTFDNAYELVHCTAAIL